jgi:hypothetical protein
MKLRTWWKFLPERVLNHIGCVKLLKSQMYLHEYDICNTSKYSNDEYMSHVRALITLEEAIGRIYDWHLV